MIWVDYKDLGSIEEVGNGDFQLLSADVDKLPTTNVKPGSSAFVLDTGDLYVFHNESKTWRKL